MHKQLDTPVNMLFDWLTRYLKPIRTLSIVYTLIVPEFPTPLVTGPSGGAF
nr:hypothetical protein Q903MT_gene445 [Picea sitchensis]